MRLRTLDRNTERSRMAAGTAQVTVSAKTPYGVSPVPVTFAVNPPKTWARSPGR